MGVGADARLLVNLPGTIGAAASSDCAYGGPMWCCSRKVRGARSAHGAASPRCRPATWKGGHVSLGGRVLRRVRSALRDGRYVALAEAPGWAARIVAG